MTDTATDRLALCHRLYTPDDRADVVALHARAFAVMARDHYSGEKIDAHARFVETADYAAELERSRLRLASERPGVLVATAGWVKEPGEPPETTKTARLSGIFVDPRFIRRGIASWMVVEAERRAWRQGCRRFLAAAFANALPFFAQIGYRPTEDRAIRLPGGIEFAVKLMERATPPAPLLAEQQGAD